MVGSTSFPIQTGPEETLLVHSTTRGKALLHMTCEVLSSTFAVLYGRKLADEGFSRPAGLAI
jgi:hypothetical protein